MSDYQLFGTDHLAVLEHWNRRGFSDRARLIENILNQLPAAEDRLKQQTLMRRLLSQAPKLGEVEVMPGPTGESNELYHTGRGDALVYASDKSSKVAILGMITGALLCGNAVIVHAPAHREWATRLCGLLHQVGVPVNVLVLNSDVSLEELVTSQPLNIVCAVCDTHEARDLAKAVAKRDGVLVQLVTETDSESCSTLLQYDFLLRLVTEKTRTNNTTAVGGNATLLELGSTAV